MNIYFIIILFAIIGEFLFRSVVRILNLKALDPNLSKEFQGYYEPDKYAQSQEYTRVNTKFAFFTSSFDLCLILVFILFFFHLDEKKTSHCFRNSICWNF